MIAPEERLLVFPAGMSRSLAFRRNCESRGIRTVGASSLGHDPSRIHYADWVQLPFVAEPAFAPALVQAIHSKGISGIFTPNQVVWDQLQRLLPSLAPQVRLVNSSPVAVEEAPYLELIQRTRDSAADALPLAASGTPRPRLEPLALAAILRMVDQVPGMCDDDKAAALCEVARWTPAGDIVEIGSWWGKSAMLLGLLARHQRLGAVLCVDPWSDEHLRQPDATLVDASSSQISAERAFEIFKINLLPIADGGLNYLRKTSVQAAVRYRADPVVEQPGFGRTRFAGRIALLHIDGNHDRAAVQADIDAWGDFVCSDGGWVVFDDYLWPYGDGPRLVADAFCGQHQNRIACAFVSGGALFVQLAAAQSPASQTR